MGEEDAVALADQDSPVLQPAAEGFTFDEIARFLLVSLHRMTSDVK